MGRDSPAATFDDLLTELSTTGGEAGSLGAVAVLRIEGQGVALVQTKERGYVRIQVDATRGTVAESLLALRVIELLRDVDLPEPIREAPPPLAPTPPPLVLSHGTPRAPRHEIWLGAGGAFASDLSTPSLWFALSASFTLFRPLSLEPSLGASALPARVESEAGEVELYAQQAAIYAMFEPFSQQDIGVAFGLGGGVMLLQESAKPSPGYRGFEDSTRVGIAGARIRGFLRSGAAVFLLAVDPGLLLPRASLELDGTATHRIGWPWITATLGAGVSL